MPNPTNATNQVDLHPVLHTEHVNVKAFGAAGDGTTDDTTAFNNAATAAGRNGTIFIPAGTYILTNWTPALLGTIHIVGAGMPGQGWAAAVGGTELKASGSATWVMKLLGTTEIVNHVSVRNLRIHGNNTTNGVTINSGADTYGSQGVKFQNVQFFRCPLGVKIDTNATTQADKNTFIDCEWPEITAGGTGLWSNATNADSTLLLGGFMTNGAIGIRMTSGNLTWISGQTGVTTTTVLFDGSSDSLTLIDFIDEANTRSLDGNTNWPNLGVHLVNTALQGSTDTVRLGVASAKLFATQSKFVNGVIRFNGHDALVVDNLCDFTASGGFVDTSGGTFANRRISTDLNGTHYYFNNFTTPVSHNYIAGGEIQGKLATNQKAGAPVDGDYYFVVNGQMAVDTTNNRLYVRHGGAWHYAALT